MLFVDNDATKALTMEATKVDLIIHWMDGVTLTSDSLPAHGHHRHVVLPVVIEWGGDVVEHGLVRLVVDFFVHFEHCRMLLLHHFSDGQVVKGDAAPGGPRSGPGDVQLQTLNL